MVTSPQIATSNALIPSHLPRNLTAIFIGATNGIGETTLREFARFTKRLAPNVIFVGRAQEAGERIARECKSLNADGEFTFLKADVGLLKGVDEGTLQTGVETEEGPSKIIAFRGHGASMATLTMEHLAKQYPNVSFIHDFPGPVKSGIARGPGVGMMIMRFMGSILGPMMNIPLEESGRRHVYLCTSARYPPKAEDKSSAVPLGEGLLIAKGTDALVGSGVYTVDEHLESGDEKVDAVLASLRREGMTEKVWKDAESEFVRITGKTKIQVG
ncbi:hypothetical protein PRZ48_007529 [Zasmidium cellare]|uniref:NAD(P)-binding protein n=1 Tax=Zasmidium cellare TaxID=395010 RepID=A0ABR0EKN8_ZASCE|nr:hypothetical protein PRZ48_007529 [Zasmidium cellare]